MLVTQRLGAEVNNVVRKKTIAGSKGSVPRYHWEEWFNSGRFTLRRGEYFICSAPTMVQNIRTAASKRGLSIRVWTAADGSTIRVTVVGGKA